MGSFARATGSSLGGAVIAAVALAAAPAYSMAAAADATTVPCAPGALISAINTANGLPAATLRLASRCIYDITNPATAADALPIITRNITLIGGQSTSIRRAPLAPTAFRILDVAAGGTLHVKDVFILSGSTAGLGGGIQNAGTLELDETTLAGNNAGNGGALANIAGGRAVVHRSVLSSNTTTGVGGGGIINFGMLTVLESHLIGNSAPINGGGINTQPGGVTRVIRSTVDYSRSSGLGGALSNLGTTSLDRTRVEFNRGSAGGGIATGNTNVTIQRSEVRRNTPDNCNPLNTIPGCVG
jgi:hypothetical protein